MNDYVKTLKCDNCISPEFYIEDNKVSLFVRYVNLEDSSAETRTSKERQEYD